jgi:hypothetical protein
MTASPAHNSTRPPFLPDVTADVRLNRVPFSPSATVQKHCQCAYAAHSATEVLLFRMFWRPYTRSSECGLPPHYLLWKWKQITSSKMSLHKHWPLAWLSLKRQAPPLAHHLHQLRKHTHLITRSSQG